MLYEVYLQAACKILIFSTAAAHDAATFATLHLQTTVQPKVLTISRISKNTPTSNESSSVVEDWRDRVLFGCVAEGPGRIDLNFGTENGCLKIATKDELLYRHNRMWDVDKTMAPVLTFECGMWTKLWSQFSRSHALRPDTSTSRKRTELRRRAAHDRLRSSVCTAVRTCAPLCLRVKTSSWFKTRSRSRSHSRNFLMNEVVYKTTHKTSLS